jgi:xanthine/uracil permease
MLSLHEAWRNAVDRVDRKDGRGWVGATVALLGLAVCTVGFVSVAVGVAIFGSDEPSALGAAVGGVIGSAFCLVLIAYLVSPPQRETQGAALLRFMTPRRWRILQIGGGVALSILGLSDVLRGNSDGWKAIVLAVIVVAATQGAVYVRRRSRRARDSGGKIR